VKDNIDGSFFFFFFGSDPLFDYALLLNYSIHSLKSPEMNPPPPLLCMQHCQSVVGKKMMMLSLLQSMLLCFIYIYIYAKYFFLLTISFLPKGKGQGKRGPP
jgi:hypothetical protein